MSIEEVLSDADSEGEPDDDDANLKERLVLIFPLFLPNCHLIVMKDQTSYNLHQRPFFFFLKINSG